MKMFTRKKIIPLILILIVILTAFFTYKYLSTPKLPLISLLPDSPFAYISAKDLDDAILSIENTEFGRKLREMPIIAEVESRLDWQELIYQKRLWEYSLQGRIDRKWLKEIVGQEAILSFYNRSEPSFLLISKIGASTKFQVGTAEASDVLDDRYKMEKKSHNGINTITVIGFPKEFTYAFIGKIGMLSTDATLINDVIDIYKKKKKGFVNQKNGSLAKEKYERDSSSFYFNLSSYPDELPLNETFKNLSKLTTSWFFSNRYGEGKLISEHHFSLPESNRQAQNSSLRFLSLTSEESAMSFDIAGVEPADLWDTCRGVFGISIQPKDRTMNLAEHLDKEVSLIVQGSNKNVLLPSMAFLIPVKNGKLLKENLRELKRKSIYVYGKKVKFANTMVYNGVQINRVDIPIHLFLSLKGGYAVVGEHLAIGSTMPILQDVIDTSVGKQNSLNPNDYQISLHKDNTGYLFIQPPTLVPEIMRMATFYSLIARLSGEKKASQIATRISKNIFPLKYLGNIGANLEIKEDTGTAEVIILSKDMERPNAVKTRSSDAIQKLSSKNWLCRKLEFSARR